MKRLAAQLQEMEQSKALTEEQLIRDGKKAPTIGCVSLRGVSLWRLSAGLPQKRPTRNRPEHPTVL